MVNRRQIFSVLLVCACLCGAGLLIVRAQVIADTLPAELSDKIPVTTQPLRGKPI